MRRDYGLRIVRLITLSLVESILLQAVCLGAIYYVDATNGNDSNDGLSPETAWKTIRRVNGYSFNPGDQILFKRGEVWREELVVSSSGEQGSPITFGAYGSVAEKPKIHNTAVINSDDFDTITGFGASFGENGDFEAPNDEPGWHWFTNTLSGGSTATKVTDVVYNKGYAIKLHKESGGSDVWFGNNVNCGDFGSKFKLRFFGKTDTGTTMDLQINCKIDDVIYYLQDDGSWSTTAHWSDNVLPENSDWAEVIREYTFPTSGTNFQNHKVWVRLNNVGDAWVDYFRLDPKWVEKSVNVWQISVYPEVQRSIIIGGERCNFVNSLGNLSQDKDVYYEDGTYYVWNAVSPELDSRTFEWIKFQNANPYYHGLPAIHTYQKSHLIFENLDIRGGDCYSGLCQGAVSLTNCGHIIIKNCIIAGSDGPGIFWYSGHNATISSNVVSEVGGGAGIMLGKNDDASVIDSFTISHNYIHHVASSPLDKNKDGHGIGLFGSISTPRTIGNGIIEYNEIAYSGRYGFGFMVCAYNSYDVVIRYNNIHNNDEGGIDVGSSSRNIDVYYNLIYDNVVTEAGGWSKSGIKISQATGGPPAATSIDNVNIFNNIIYGNDDVSGTTEWGHRAGIAVIGHDIFSLNNISIKNNIVYNNYVSAGVYGHELRLGSGPTYNNVVFDNNFYFRTSNTENMIWYLGDIYALNQFSTYQSEQGQDANSIAASPLFVNPANENFHLKSTSPAIDAGVNVGLTQDFEGNPVPQGSAPDIGAYEYVSSTLPCRDVSGVCLPQK